MGDNYNFIEFVDGKPMNTLERMEHYKMLLAENIAQITEGYLRHLDRSTLLLSELTKPNSKIDAIRRIIPDEMDDLRTYAELFDIAMKLNNSLFKCLDIKI